MNEFRANSTDQTPKRLRCHQPETEAYLIADGHGSTRALVDASGVTVQTMDYDAFGNALDFDAQTVDTPWLFGGDGMYDAASGVYWHGNGIRARQDFRFLQMDTYAGSTSDPISLHKYLYTSCNPINYIDPSGRFEMSINSMMSSIGIVSVFSGLVGGSISRLAGGSFAEGFFKSSISTGVTLTLLAVTPVKSPNIALAIGQIVANSSVDIVSGKAQANPKLFVVNMAVSVLTAITLNAMWSNFVPGVSANVSRVAIVIEQNFPKGSLDVLAKELSSALAKGSVLGIWGQVPKLSVKMVDKIIELAMNISEERLDKIQKEINNAENGR